MHVIVSRERERGERKYLSWKRLVSFSSPLQRTRFFWISGHEYMHPRLDVPLEMEVSGLLRFDWVYVRRGVLVSNTIIDFMSGVPRRRTRGPCQSRNPGSDGPANQSPLSPQTKGIAVRGQEEQATTTQLWTWWSICCNGTEILCVHLFSNLQERCFWLLNLVS